MFKNFVNTVVFLIIIIIIIIIILILKFLNNSGTLYFKSSSNKVYKYKTILTVDIEIKVQIIDYGTIIMIIFLPCQDLRHSNSASIIYVLISLKNDSIHWRDLKYCCIKKMSIHVVYVMFKKHNIANATFKSSVAKSIRINIFSEVLCHIKYRYTCCNVASKKIYKYKH